MPIGIFIVMNDAGIFQKLFEKHHLEFLGLFSLLEFLKFWFFFKLQGKEMATKI